MRNVAKKVFFLYPHSVVQGQMIDLLIQSEFEVAVLKDHQRALRLLSKFPSSILFVNIEEHLSQDDWEVFIRNIVQGNSVHDSRVGVMVYNPNKELAQKYLIDIGVQCGFIQLKLGLTESAKIVLKALTANEAKGDRKFVRVSCQPGKATLNIRSHQDNFRGEIMDISSAGFACVLDGNPETGTEFDDMQLSLRGAIIHASGKLMGKRSEEGQEVISVIMFSEIDREVKGKIYQFIRKTLQAEIDSI
ncbi:hypothetical protein L21SP2_2367 [Salinispira pacifica]|uniref:PilZ domain-containing protein n=1 Tax=Salinispira pacifica TaxID=1307761 RepID=V5WJA8_9SPIO|nr:hypothetical protein L21SP2_2367 [Salinispira pacifica]